MGLIQFCLSAPKTDMENNVVVSDYAAMDRILREERKYILGLCKKVIRTRKEIWFWKLNNRNIGTDRNARGGLPRARLWLYLGRYHPRTT